MSGGDEPDILGVLLQNPDVQQGQTLPIQHMAGHNCACNGFQVSYITSVTLYMIACFLIQI